MLCRAGYAASVDLFAEWCVMFCYRDRSYCSAFGETCINAECGRALLPDEKAQASIMGYPIAYTDFSTVCAAIIEPETKENTNEVSI